MTVSDSCSGVQQLQGSYHLRTTDSGAQAPLIAQIEQLTADDVDEEIRALACDVSDTIASHYSADGDESGDM